MCAADQKWDDFQVSGPGGVWQRQGCRGLRNWPRLHISEGIGARDSKGEQELDPHRPAGTAHVVPPLDREPQPRDPTRVVPRQGGPRAADERHRRRRIGSDGY